MVIRIQKRAHAQDDTNEIILFRPEMEMSPAERILNCEINSFMLRII